MKHVGIWVDKSEAKIISTKNGNEYIKTITPEIDHFNPLDESGTKVEIGPQDEMHAPNAYSETESHQLIEFFKTLVPSMEDTNAIVIFDPAQSGKKMNTEFKAKHPTLSTKIISVEKTDDMTDNQSKAWVKAFFNKKRNSK